MSAISDLFTLKAKPLAGEGLPAVASKPAAPDAPARAAAKTPRVKAPAPVVRRVSKSAAAYRTISEVAAELDVATHVLRFWESKFTVIKPLKKSGGRRYYKPEDIALLRHIQDLLYHQGYTIKGVQAHLSKTRKKDLQQAVQQAMSPAQLKQDLKMVRDMLAGEVDVDGDDAATAHAEDRLPAALRVAAASSRNG